MVCKTTYVYFRSLHKIVFEIKKCDIESVEKYKNYLISCFDKLPKNPQVYIIGDLNCDMLKKDNLSSRINDKTGRMIS